MKLPKLPRFLLKKKIYIPLAIIFLLVFYFVFLKGNKPPTVETAQVKKQDIKDTVSASGILTGKNVANLKFKSSGTLSYIQVKAGDNVKEGAAIAGLDTQDLTISLQQAQNNLKDEQAVVDKILDDVKNNDTSETFTQKQERTTAQVGRDNAYDSVKAAQRAFQDAVITSPIAGVVTVADPVPGQTVSPSDLIAQVIDWSGVYFDSDIDEADISKVNLGQLAEVTLDSYPNQVFKGTVSEIKPSTKTTSSGATVITVRILLDNPNIHLIYGLNGQVNIVASEKPSALTIPLEALKDDTTVVVKAGNSYKEVKITQGIESDTDAEITSGLSAGDIVVLNPPDVALLNQKSPLAKLFGR